MRKVTVSFLYFFLVSVNPVLADEGQYRRISMTDYVDKMKAGWVGQMVGVGWGGPTEFKYASAIIPATAVPQWEPGLINQFGQDDLYVEMTFLRTLEQYGLGVSGRQAGIDFANSAYPLWCANLAGRNNLWQGIAPPDSGHPQFNKHSDDIDYQIEADFSGLISPGLPNSVRELGETFGRIMNYGDGLYGGLFVGGMYAEAFFEKDIEKIILAGLACIPPDSQYAECIRDVLQWWKEHPDDWQTSWQKINEKYQLNPEYRRFSSNKIEDNTNIDAKINGAYIVMGLLYGGGDIEKTIVISTRCGQDSDCNPSNAGGLLFTTMGLSSVPEQYISALDTETRFSHTDYSFSRLVDVCQSLATQVVLRAGGRIEKDDNGNEVLVIPRLNPRPGKLEQSWQPGPIAGSRFSEEEMGRIQPSHLVDVRKAVEFFAPGWKIRDCGIDMNPGMLELYLGRKNVLVTHPLNRETACVLSRRADVPTEGVSELHLLASHHPSGDWDLVVKVEGKELQTQSVGAKTAGEDGWLEMTVDLSPYAGKSILIELLNQPSGWSYEAAYWGEIAIRRVQ